MNQYIESKKKIKVRDRFYGMYNFYFNSIPVTVNNITDFDLHLLYSGKTADIYSVTKTSKIKVIHVKDKNFRPKGKVNNYTENGYVDWFEASVKETIKFLENYEKTGEL